jgi:hypothetical protein
VSRHLAHRRLHAHLRVALSLGDRAQDLRQPAATCAAANHTGGGHARTRTGESPARTLYYDLAGNKTKGRGDARALDMPRKPSSALRPR